MTKGYEGTSSDLDVEGLLEELWGLVNMWMKHIWFKATCTRTLGEKHRSRP